MFLLITDHAIFGDCVGMPYGQFTRSGKYNNHLIVSCFCGLNRLQKKIIVKLKIREKIKKIAEIKDANLVPC